jgi:hypothetical protein
MANVRFRNYKWGYINNKGETCIAPQYLKCGSFSEGKATVIKDKFTQVIDIKGSLLFQLEETSLGMYKEGMLLLNNHFYNEQGKAEGDNYSNASSFCGGTSIVKQHSQSILLNRKMETLACYDYISPATNNRSTFYIVRRMGIADEEGKIISLPKFQGIDIVEEGLFKITHFDSFGYLTSTGKWLWKP